jgi:protein-disulfide isomerase-like protein with CxxC motif
VAVPAPVTVVHLSDPGCPWAYAAAPALTLLRWRYGGGLAWRAVMIGLAEDPRRYLARGTTPASQAKGYRRFRRYGMPFATEPRARVVATGRACRAVVATRLLDPAREDAAFRALQFAHFTSTLLFDTDRDLRTALGTVPGLDAEAVVRALDDEAVEAAYQADRALARTAAGSPTAAQGKSANTDGLERYTAPSLRFLHRDGHGLEAGGFQPVEAYDVLIANLDPTLDRSGPATDVAAVLQVFPYPLTTREVAAILAAPLQPVDDEATEALLIDAAADGRVRRAALGDGAVWWVA